MLTNQLMYCMDLSMLLCVKVRVRDTTTKNYQD